MRSMPGQPFPALNTILFKLLAELEAYESSVQRMTREWQTTQDLVLFGETGRSMDRMRSLAVALPELSAQWLMVMISHTELMHNLWRVSKGESLHVSAEVEGHLACVSAMAASWRRLLTQGRPVLH
jgi:hypothetical protein